MVDVHDIDALLISALYGELTPADEARLSAHLESHPTDRTALADLTRARTLVHDSRILTFQLDPPQAVSAILLQEAARRAPAVRREPSGDGRESWFFRFVRSFSSHPAMAAAAMLVLVVGAAGVMKMRDRGDFAEAPVESRAATPPAATAAVSQPAPVVAAAVPPAEPLAEGHGAIGGDGEQKKLEARGAAVNGVSVGLADPSEQEVTLPMSKISTGEAQYRTAPPTKPAPPSAAHAIGKKGIDVTTPQLMIKDDDEGDRDASKDRPRDAKPEVVVDGKAKAAPGGPGAGGVSGGGAATAPATTLAAPVQPPPPPSPTPMPAKSPAADRSVEQPSDARRADNSLAAWASGQLDQVVQLAKDNKCEDAAKVAATISARAPDFYAQNVATNRDLKQCMAYIAAAHDRAEKAAAQQRASKRATDSSK